MQWRNLPAVITNKLHEVESSPQVARAIATMDQSIRFMTEKEFVSDNSALQVVRKPLVAGLWVMLALFMVTLIWGALVPIDSATVARGTVKLLSNKKTVQHLEGGIINEILVKEGDKVAAGQPLITLNDTAATANRDTLREQLYVARATLARLVAARDKQADVAFDQDMLESSKTNQDVAKILMVQKQLFLSSQEAEAARLKVLEQRKAQAQEHIEGLKSQITGVSQQIDLLKQELDTVQTLLAKGLATKMRLFELQRNVSGLEGNKGQYEADIEKTQQNIGETEMEILNQQKEFETKNAQDLRDAEVQVNELKEKLRAAQDVVGRTVIAAPNSGVVTGLKYHTAGGVIAAGAPIMDIVPQDDQLVIEAQVKANDIGVVHDGLPARVLFTAYKMRTTPKVPGKVTQVSADSFSDEHNPQAGSYYLARVEVDKRFLNQLKRPVTLYPGMPAEVLIRTGSRSFLAYLFKPITDSMQGAFREE